MKIIMKTVHGSHLYGTNTPTSDFDYKAVYIPSPRQILIKETESIIQESKDDNDKKNAGDLDIEYYTLDKYLNLFSQGQTNAIDMFFASGKNLEITSPIWEEILKNKDKLISKKTNAFVGYCKAQANKYGIKGNRIATAKAALELLEKSINSIYGKESKLGLISDEIEAFVKEFSEHSFIEDVTQTSGTVVRFWVVCGRKMAYTTSFLMCYNIIDKLVNEYGHRALSAKNSNGIDWKALSHAVRVGEEAIELLSTGEIQFPLKNAQYILDIKLGKYSYDHVSEYIEKLLVDVEETTLNSSLPDHPDYKWIKDFVFDVYEQEIVNEYTKRSPIEKDWKLA